MKDIITETLQEIRLDWENTLDDHFNPLHMAISIIKGSVRKEDFRYIFNKLELSMESVISLNFRGFSDSVLSFNEFHKKNLEILKLLEDSISSTNIDFENSFNKVKEIEKTNRKSEYFRDKYEILRSLRHAKTMFEEYQNTTDLLKRCNQLIRCLDLIDNKELLEIKGVFEYRKYIYREYVKLAELVNIKIFSYVFHNQINNSFKCCVILGSLYEFEKFVKVNFKSFLFDSIEKIILKNSTSTITFESLCQIVSIKIEKIIENYQSIIDLIFSSFKLKKDKEDFFGNKDESYSFTTNIKKILKIIEDELENFINRYSASIDIQGEFNLENVLDNVNYNKIYSDEFNIFKKKETISSNAVKSANSTSINLVNSAKLLNTSNSLIKTYTLIVTPLTDVVSILLKYIKNQTLRIFLTKKVQVEYSKFKLEKNKTKISTIISIPTNPFGRSFNDGGGNPTLSFTDNFTVELDLKGKCLMFMKDLNPILNDLNNNNNSVYYNTSLRKHIIKRIKEFFKSLESILFKSKIVKGNYEKINIYSGEEGFISEFDPTFKEALTNKYLSKNDLLLLRKKYLLASYSFNTIKELDDKLNCKEIDKIYEGWTDLLKKQLNVEFFYYFDLYYREGNYKSNSYFKKIVDIFNLIYKETKTSILFDGLYANIEFYCKNNVNSLKVKSKEDLKNFICQLRIFDETMGEVEFHGNLNSLYEFYDKILVFKSNEQFGKIIENKIK